MSVPPLPQFNPQPPLPSPPQAGPLLPLPPPLAYAPMSPEARLSLARRLGKPDRGQLQTTHIAKAIHTDAVNQLQNPDSFPTQTLTAAIKAYDVITPIPKALEDRVIRIATLYLSGNSPAQIARELDLDETEVKREINLIAKERRTALAHDPDLANKIVEAHFDVALGSVELIQDGGNLLRAVREELMSDHSARLDADVRKDPYRSKMGISPLKLQAYFTGVEAIGKQQDRLAAIQGLLDKDRPTQPGSNVNININTSPSQAFVSKELSILADQLLLNAGHSVISAQVVQEDHLNRTGGEDYVKNLSSAAMALQSPEDVKQHILDLVAIRGEV